MSDRAISHKQWLTDYKRCKEKLVFSPPREYESSPQTGRGAVYSGFNDAAHAACRLSWPIVHRCMYSKCPLIRVALVPSSDDAAEGEGA